MTELLVILLVVGAALALATTASRRNQAKELEQRRKADLEAVRTVADEDVTQFGEELQTLDDEMRLSPLDTATRQDYQRALESYEHAKTVLRDAERPDDVKQVTQALEDGRYSVACVLARRDGEPLPVRRPPCFFNPTHGPSIYDIEWAPPAGVARSVPVCAADKVRVEQGAEPDIRTVRKSFRRVPYWQAGPAYSPWAMGYYGAYAHGNLLPSLLVLTMLSPGWHGEAVPGAETDFGAGDAGGGEYAGDYGGEYGGDYGGSDYTGGDFGGDNFGGGFDGGFNGGIGGFDGGGLGF